MMEEIGLLEAMHSQMSITRYKPDPVPREAIDRVVEAATKAPSGGNMQPWHFLVITDRDLIAHVGGIYREEWLGRLGVEPPPDEPPAYRAARYLAHHIHEAPVLILICVVDDSRTYVPGKPGQPALREREASSIWLAAQNLFLAARGLGLGTRLTTTHTVRESEIKELLGIPDHVETVALTPLGYPRGKFGPTVRRPAAEVTSYNKWGSQE